MKNVGVILGSGIGARFGASFPKQFMSLNGKMIIQHSIDAMKESGVFDHIICTMPPDSQFSNYNKQLKNIDQIIIGGRTRTETILHVLDECPDCTNIVFHDSVRPFMKSEHFRYGLEILERKKLDYLLTVQKITDALISYEPYSQIKGQNRLFYWLCQTPEFFYLNSLKERKKDLLKNMRSYNYIGQTFSHETFKSYTGDIIEYEGNNLKITYERDLFNAEQLMKYTEINEMEIPDLKGKKILIFGGSGDIGKAIIQYAKEKEAIIKAPTRKEYDLTNLQYLYAEHEQFDCVIHCAGAYVTDNENIIESYPLIMNLNFKSVIETIYLAEKFWLKNGGNIVILGSIAGGYGRKGISLYSASKSAINAFVEGYYSHLMEKDIRINVIAPAKVQGKLQTMINPQSDQSQMIKPERLAEIIGQYMTTKKTGQIVYIRYGLEGKHE